MPWQPEPFFSVIQEVKAFLFNHFKVNATASVYICSAPKMELTLLEELEDRDLSEIKLNHVKKFYIKRVIGKYFSKKNEIWLLDGKGDNLEVMIHELLHSIQKCSPNREQINDYLVYNLTGLKNQITEESLKEWLEIEKSYGFKRIKHQFLLNKDCEDF